MGHVSTRVRVLLTVLAVLILAGSVASLIQFTDTALSTLQRLADMPWWFAGPISLLLFAFGVGTLWLLVRMLLPPRRTSAPVPLSVETLRMRAEKLAQPDSADVDTGGKAIARGVSEELALLEQRAQENFVYVAFFGEVNSGKSSLIQTLVGADLAVNVVAGSTNAIDLYPLPLKGEQTIILADVPGTNEVRAPHLANLAREEALRAHVVALIVSGDLSRSAALEWQWLRQFQKPMWMILNKSDRYSPEERSRLLARLRQRLGADIIAVEATHEQEFVYIDVDGRESPRTRTVAGDVGALKDRLLALRATQRSVLEVTRQHAILAHLDGKIEASEQLQRHQLGQQLIRQFTRRAMVGAMAAVAPGSDLLIQGALGIGLTHQLCSLYGVNVTQIELEALVKAIGGKLRGSVALIIAIVGNGLKAFPGLGTLSGGALHAIAYGLIFDRIGHALQESLEQLHRVAKPGLLPSDVLQRLDSEWRDTAALLRQARALAQDLKSQA